jgi:hypothetical protein
MVTDLLLGGLLRGDRAASTLTVDGALSIQATRPQMMTQPHWQQLLAHYTHFLPPPLLLISWHFNFNLSNKHHRKKKLVTSLFHKGLFIHK